MTRALAAADDGAAAPERRHGARLACFRPVRRFCAPEDDEARALEPWDVVAKRSARGVPARQQLACDCECQVLQCHFAGADARSRADSAQVEELYLARLRKWRDKFEAHDWKHERVCQKWKENHKRFEMESEERERSAAERETRDGRRRVMAATSASWTDVDADADDGGDDKLSPSKAAGQAVRQAFTNLTSAAEVMIQSRQFDNLVRAGIPPQFRGQVWWMCSGAAELRDAAAESYANLVARIHTLSKSTAMDIEKDLPRTFPVDLSQSQDMSASLGAGAGAGTASGIWENDGARRRYKSISELRRVLQAYSLRNPSIGYCQSMNFLAAVLLHQMEEEEAFWVLAAIVEELTPQYHTRSMAGSRADQRVFSDLVQQKLPALYRHMQRLGVDFEPFTLKWFLCLFLNTLPFEPVMRIWDVFFCEGSHVLLRVGLALLKLNQPRILACDDAFDVYEMFKLSHDMLQAVTAPFRSGLLNRDECVCDTLVRLSMDKSFVGPIPFDSLHELRAFYRNEIEAELRAVDARRQEQTRSTASLQASTTSGAGYLSTRTSGRGPYSTAGGHGDGSDAEEADASSTELEYDFVDEYASRSSEISPAKHIHFLDLYDSDDAADYFIDVKYDLTCSLPAVR